MISNAQNCEDVMLARVFAEQSGGFYIDVGAWDPDSDSVTRYFYDLGWCGINVEPTLDAFERLVAARPRDINLNVALGEASGELTLFQRPETGLSSLVPPGDGEGAVCSRTVAVSTLAALCERHADGRTIDFLKIDVEGWEEPVIRGADWTRFRPRVVLVEATEPNSQTPAWDGWEPLLLQADYRFVYFDGLNRFYVRGEDADLARFFTTPPNVFDHFMRATEANALAESERRGAAMAAGDHRLEALNGEYEKLRALLQEREAEIAALRAEYVALEAMARQRVESFEALRREYDALTQLAVDSDARHAALAAEYAALTQLCQTAHADADRLRRSPAMRYFAWLNGSSASKP